MVYLVADKHEPMQKVKRINTKLIDMATFYILTGDFELYTSYSVTPEKHSTCMAKDV